MQSKMRDDECGGFFEEHHLQEYLDRVSRTLKISGAKYSVELGTKKGDDHIGLVYHVSIEGENDGIPVMIETVLKVPPADEERRRIGSVSVFFPREHNFYTKILPACDEFLKMKNKELGNIVRCYFSTDDDHKEAICLEYLKPKGFVMRDRMEPMDFSHTSLAFRALGRLHAISFALRDQRPEIFAEKIAVLKEAAFTPEVIADKTMITRFERLGKLALGEEDPKYMKRFSEFSNDVLNQLKRSCDGNAAEPYAVLCHGDFWSNNMLFKYDEDSEEPRDIHLLDFQLSRFASPATDLSYNLFCCCGQELREKHFDDLVKIYHDSLSDYLLELGSDPEKLFPFEALVDQLNRFSTFGAGMAILVLSFFASQGDDIEIAVLNEDPPRLEQRINSDQFLRNTYKDTFKDLIDRNYIQDSIPSSVEDSKL